MIAKTNTHRFFFIIINLKYCDRKAERVRIGEGGGVYRKHPIISESSKNPRKLFQIFWAKAHASVLRCFSQSSYTKYVKVGNGT